MSRPVKDLRRANDAAPAKNATPKGTQKAYGRVTRTTGRETPGNGAFETQTTPGFDRPGKRLSKYDGY